MASPPHQLIGETNMMSPIFTTPEELQHATDFFNSTFFAHLRDEGHNDEEILALLEKAMKTFDPSDIKEPVHKTTPEGMMTSNMVELSSGLLATQYDVVAMFHLLSFEAFEQRQNSSVH